MLRKASTPSLKERGDKKRMGKVMRRRNRNLNMTQGRQGFEWMYPECIVGSCYLSIQKTQIIQVWVNEFEEQEDRGPGADSIQITCVVYPPG